MESSVLLIDLGLYSPKFISLKFLFIVFGEIAHLAVGHHISGVVKLVQFKSRSWVHQ